MYVWRGSLEWPVSAGIPWGLLSGDGWDPAKKGKVRVWVSDGSLPLFAVGKPRVELPPGIQRLPRPDPEARCDAHN